MHIHDENKYSNIQKVCRNEGGMGQQWNEGGMGQQGNEGGMGQQGSWLLNANGKVWRARYGEKY